MDTPPRPSVRLARASKTKTNSERAIAVAAASLKTKPGAKAGSAGVISANELRAAAVRAHAPCPL
jgi:hypothetical protein